MVLFFFFTHVCIVILANSTHACTKLHVLSSCISVAVITHIASLVLGYDMRRLNDITAFRRYWYSISLIEMLFIGSKSKPGDDTMTATPTMKVKSPSTASISEDESVGDIDNTISATIAAAANVADFRVAVNFAQVMGHAE